MEGRGDARSAMRGREHRRRTRVPCGGRPAAARGLRGMLCPVATAASLWPGAKCFRRGKGGGTRADAGVRERAAWLVAEGYGPRDSRGPGCSRCPACAHVISPCGPAGRIALSGSMDAHRTISAPAPSPPPGPLSCDRHGAQAGGPGSRRPAGLGLGRLRGAQQRQLRCGGVRRGQERLRQVPGALVRALQEHEAGVGGSRHGFCGP